MTETADWRPPFVPETSVGAEGDNIFELIGNCRGIARQLGWPQTWISAFTSRITATRSYEDACAVIREHFTLE